MALTKIKGAGINISATEKLYFDGGGDTYIHESAADVLKLVVGGVAFMDATEGTNAIVFNEGSVDMDFRVESNGNANMLFVDGGNDRVGIGIASPDGTLHVHTATAGSITANSISDDLVIENSAGGGLTILTPDANDGRISIGSASDNIGAALIWNYDSGLFTIGSDKVGGQTVFTSNNGNEAMRIDASKNVGIGVTPQAWDTTRDVLQIGTAGFLASRNNANVTYLGNNWYRDTEGADTYIGNDEAIALELHNSGNFYLKTAPAGTGGISWTTPLTVANTGDVTIGTGDIVFATAGKGICLGVTSNTDANTLDDYEEGKYEITIGGATAGMDTGKDSLQYTKIGRLVTVSGEISITSISSNTGTFTVTLPFTVASGVGELSERFQGTFSCQNVNFSGDYINIGSYAGQTTMSCQITNGNGGWTYLNTSTMSTSTEFVISVQYIAA